ncbi:MAG: hypothetical protein IH830_11890 [Planctomycetes bacterium]|nr:hypothetical protein [Planctomycetota bacterium]
METPAHQHLKSFAMGFLRGLGCQAVATEVRCPISQYRVDVAGYLDTVALGQRSQPSQRRRAGPAVGIAEPRRSRRQRCDPRTIVIECKQSRADFLRDRREADRLLALRSELERIRRHIEERQIKVYEPHLRRSGSSLFPELEVWDFSASRQRAYRQVIQRIRRVERQLHGDTKLFTVARYQLADRLYLAAPRGIIRQRDLPSGWGLLECSQEWLREPGTASRRPNNPPLSITVEAPQHSSRPQHRLRLLRNIAVAACRPVLGRECWLPLGE